MRPRRIRPFRLGLGLGVLGAAAWFVQRYQRSRNEVERLTSTGWSAVAEPDEARVAAPVVDDAPAPAEAPVLEKAAPVKKAAAKKRAAAKKQAAWVAPDDEGTCPASHPVKAKLSSQLFHLPGMFAYERTNADRCYPDEASAEADGLRKAKR